MSKGRAGFRGDVRLLIRRYAWYGSSRFPLLERQHRLRPVAIASLAIVFLSLSATSQTPVRDPQGVNVLTQSITAAGGAVAIGSIQDFRATGTITFFWAGTQVTASATVRGRGWDQYRVDASLAQGTRSHAVSHGQGALRDTDGTLKAIPYHNTINTGILTFPYPGILARLNDPTTSITYVALVSIGGRQYHRVRVQRQFVQDTNGTLSRLTTTDYFIDAQTYLVFKALDRTHPVGTFTRDYTHEMYFDNYTAVSSVSVPMFVREKVAGQTIWELRLSSASFNVGLTDADFTL